MTPPITTIETALDAAACVAVVATDAPTPIKITLIALIAVRCFVFLIRNVVQPEKIWAVVTGVIFYGCAAAALILCIVTGTWFVIIPLLIATAFSIFYDIILNV